MNHVKKSFDGNGVLKDISLKVNEGEVVSIIGPSGSGKSTLLRCATLLEKMDGGELIYLGQTAASEKTDKNGRIQCEYASKAELHKIRKCFGLVFQNYALYPHMTVEQNIMFPLVNMRIPKEEAKAKALDAARLVQIEDLMARKPSELSGGQQQRVAIARTLAPKPKVLFMDEPLSNLDAKLRLEMRTELKRLHADTDSTFVYVTHDQEEAMSICDIMVVMKLGVVQQIGEPQRIYDDPNNLFVANFLGTPPINIFKGKIENGKVYIGDEAVIKTKLADQNVYVGIRPEGFIYDEKGVLTLNVDHVEVMGRDKTVVSQHPSSTKPTVRSILDSDVKLPENAKVYKFNIKPNKLFLFNAESEERIL